MTPFPTDRPDEGHSLPSLPTLSPREMEILRRRAQIVSQVEKEQGSSENSLSIIAFTLNQRGYAVPVDYLAEIVSRPKITSIPCVPEFLMGAVNLRGNIITVTDLEAFLGIGRTQITVEEQFLIVVENIHVKTAFLVNQVEAYQVVSRNDIEPPMMNMEDSEFQEVLGEVRLNQKLYALLDMKLILESPHIIVQ